MAKKVAAKKPKFDQEKRDQITADIKRRTEAKELTVKEACAEHGIVSSQYYSWLPKAKKERKNKMQIKEFTIPNTGKTLLIITDDQTTISNIIATFNRS